MTVLSISRFDGMVPRMTKRALPDEKLQTAIDLVADSQEFRPLPDDSLPASIGGVGGGTTVKTLYRHPIGSATLKGTNLALSMVRSQIVDDQHGRVYASTLTGEAEYEPRVLTSSSTSPDTYVDFLGVAYPVDKPTLEIATATTTLLSHGDADGYRQSVMARIKSIVHSALEPVLWPGSVSLGAGFRQKSGAETTGLYQRIWGLTNPANTDPEVAPAWNTYNSTAVDRHLWLTAVSNPAFKDESGVRVFYADFHAQVLTWRLKTDDLAAQTADLVALKLNAESDPLFSAIDAENLWAALRAVIPNDPAATASAELKTLLERFTAQRDALTNHLGQGFDPLLTTPQAGMQAVAKAGADLQSTVDAVTTFYDGLAGAAFDTTVTAYLQEIRFQDRLPEGETALDELRYYTYTYVNAREEESKPYLPGDGNSDEDLPSITVNQIQEVTVTVPALPSGITKWRLYRSASSATTAAFQFVAEVSDGLTYTDDRATSALGESLQTTTWFPPPEHSDGKYLRHLVGLPNGFLAGFVENTVYFSEPNHPYAWPVQYAIPCQSQIIALGVFGVTLVVLTEGGVSYISGSHPEEMSKVDIETTEVCVSPRSVTPVAGGVVFASRNGLCLATQSGVTNLTANLYGLAEWKRFNISSIVCDEYGGVIYMTDSVLSGYKLSAALHVPTGKLVAVTLDATAFYSDRANGKLYAALRPAGGAAPQYVELFGGSGYRSTAFGRTKRLVLPKETGFAWLAVEGEQSAANPLDLDIFGYYVGTNGVEVEVKIGTAHASPDFDTKSKSTDPSVVASVSSAVVRDTRPFRVSPGRYKDFEIAFSGKCRIDSITLASELAELQGVN